MQQKIEVLIGICALMVMNLFLLHLQKCNRNQKQYMNAQSNY